MTLLSPQPDAHGIIRQYALLLLSTILIAGSFLLQPPSTLSCQVAGALALHHVGPLIRAVNRVSKGESIRIWNGLGGPLVHMGIHGLCVAALAVEALKVWKD